MKEFEREKAAKKGNLSGMSEIAKNIVGMPKVMQQLGVVQFFS